MNDEPSSSASAAALPVPEDGENDRSTAAEVAERRKKNRENFNRRRGDLLDDLLQNLDVLAYAELSTIYYMDCQFLLFALRSMIQLLYLTPKPVHFPEPPRNSSYLAAVFGSNMLCMLLHCLRDAPLAGEATRGYLHGSVAMDFIGQKGPSSKLHLVLLDMLVLGLQILHVATNIMRRKLKEKPTLAIPTSGIVDAATDAPAVSSGQDLDLEERGVRRSAEFGQQQDIEMSTLNPSGTRSGDLPASNNEGSSSEQESLLASTEAMERTDAHIFDAFNSGQIVLADLDLSRTLKDVILAQMKNEPEDAATTESHRRLRERVLGRMFRWEFSA